MVPWADSWTPGLAPPWQGRKYTAHWPSLGASGLHAVDTLPFILWSLMHGWDWPPMEQSPSSRGPYLRAPKGRAQVPWTGLELLRRCVGDQVWVGLAQKRSQKAREQ